MSICASCNRPLTDPKSIVRGVGPDCASKLQAATFASGANMQTDLEFDPETMDILCLRDEAGIRHFNIFRHAGMVGAFEWGDALLPGCSDFALNILDLFCRAAGYRGVIKLREGRVTRPAWHLHQRFKEEFIVKLPREGARIPGQTIRTWLERRGVRQ